MDFRVHLKEKGYARNTIITTMTSVSTFYHHFDITILKLPTFSYDESPNDGVEFRDLPTIDDIRAAIENTRSLRRKAMFCLKKNSRKLLKKSFYENWLELNGINF